MKLVRKLNRLCNTFAEPTTSCEKGCQCYAFFTTKFKDIPWEQQKNSDLTQFSCFENGREKASEQKIKFFLLSLFLI